MISNPATHPITASERKNTDGIIVSVTAMKAPAGANESPNPNTK
jgi:hypothetical protein